ncbi:NTP transferase domain-containing protein [Candidatus Woesebacteria bacterium]|nr:NTP transferase domain-containing protein [Candidatus Woesebacteria bacterium]
MQKPTILIIAGGENSRFAPINTKTHKGFLSLAGKPIVERAFESLKKQGFVDVVLVVSPKDYDNAGFSEYLHTHDFGLNIQVILQEKATGMGDTILLAKEYLGENFILAAPYYSDLGSISERLWLKQQETKASCVFSGTQTTNPELYGILKFDETDKSRVVGVVEKPAKGTEPSDIKIDSVYLLNNTFIQELSETKQTEYSLEDAITSFAEKNHITWTTNKGHIQSLKYPWHLFNLFNQVMPTQKTTFAQSAQIADTAIFDDSNGPVVVDENATIGDFAKLVGPCYVGKNCLVGDYSFVRGSSLEKGATVGANTEVVRSILFENSSIHYGYLADSILGHATKIGAGLITANKRLDRKNIRIEVKKALINTETNAIGIITGENVNIGIRVNTMPGITIGANAEIHPGVTITRNVPAKEIIKK